VLTFVDTVAQGFALVAGSVLVAATALKGRVTAAHFGLRPARVASSAGFVLLGYVVFIGIAAAWTTALGITDRQSIPIQLGSRDSTAALLMAGLLTCVVAPVCEELFFRGFLFGALRKHGLVVAALVSGVAFGGAHVASSPIGFIVPLAVLGVILALLYERTGSLYPSMALHALNNSIAFGVGDGRAWLVPICVAVSGLMIYGLSRAVRARPGWRTVVPSA
jgi:membrane protease YdiL (CAAX protease family)